MELILEHLEKQKRIYSDPGDITEGVDDTLHDKAADDDVQAVDNANDLTIDDLPPAHSTRRRRRQPPSHEEHPLQPPRKQSAHLTPPLPPSQRPNDDLNAASRQHLRTAINNAWMKLNTYYDRTDDTPVYMAALVLHPGHKWKYVEEKWMTSIRNVGLSPPRLEYANSMKRTGRIKRMLRGILHKFLILLRNAN